MIRLIAPALILTACSSDKREYHPPAGSGVTDSSYTPAYSHSNPNQPPPYRPSPRAEAGEVLGLSYDESPGSGGVTLGYLGGVALGAMTPFGMGPNTSHVPTYRIRLSGNRVVYARDPGCPPLIRGSRVIFMPQPDGSCRIVPEYRR